MHDAGRGEILTGGAVMAGSKQKELVIAHLRYAKNLARKFYRNRMNIGIDCEDFESAAFFGLCDAARRFDQSRGFSFRTFSYLRIMGAMYDLLRAELALTREQFHLFFDDEETLKENQRISKRRSTRKPPYQIAYTPEELVKLSPLIEESGIKLHYHPSQKVVQMSYASALDPELLFVDRVSRTEVRGLVADLPAKERKVIEMRYFAGLSFDEIRKMFPRASRSWMSRVHQRALGRLEKLLHGGTPAWNALSEAA
jgi:RNA polymerase sigma factor FliA